jgi:hypothetical protein
MSVEMLGGAKSKSCVSLVKKIRPDANKNARKCSGIFIGSSYFSSIFNS